MARAFFFSSSFFFLSLCLLSQEGLGTDWAEMVAQSGTTHRVFSLRWLKEHFSISEARALTYLSADEKGSGIYLIKRD